MVSGEWGGGCLCLCLCLCLCRRVRPSLKKNKQHVKQFFSLFTFFFFFLFFFLFFFFRVLPIGPPFFFRIFRPPFFHGESCIVVVAVVCGDFGSRH